MNYLAHAYLSFKLPEILAGNMSSDFIKGRVKYQFPQAVQKGIALHRLIDDFTDFHPVTQQAKEIFRPQYRLYSGPFIDIVYDHFLANDSHEFSTPQQLLDFTIDTYSSLSAQQEILPVRFRQMLPYMISGNWLYNYRLEDGIRNSFQGLVRRAKYLDESAVAFQLFLKHYRELQQYYALFFPSLKAFVLKQLADDSL